MVETSEADSSHTINPNSQISSMTNYQSPIHSSMIITSHRLNGTNYLEWSQSVRLAIDGRGKLGYITGEIQPKLPAEEGYRTWRSENSLITAWLLNSMEPLIAKPHMFMKTAKEVWDSIKETYSDLENSSQIFELKTKLWQSKQGNRDIISYYNEMVSLWQELDQCYDDEEWESAKDLARHKKKEENDRVYMFLAGINRDLDEVKGRILGKKPLPSIREVFSEIRMEDSRKKVMYNTPVPNEEPGESSALVARSDDNKKKPWCDQCKKLWHTRDTCWKLHGKPPGAGKKKVERALQTTVTETQQEAGVEPKQLPFTQEQIEYLLKFIPTQKISNQENPTCSFAQNGKITSYFCSEKPKNTWVIDSGATDHMTYIPKFFSSYQPCAGDKKVRVEDGSFSAIAGMGNIKISSSINLSKVLHVPKLSCNLISISKITKDLQCCVKFFPLIAFFRIWHQGR
ncbi:unnamed protein product [Cuscuta europaea]|uniref:Retrotransposon Copia-like N-terminal domain-containing protein n=1 Tax=Cuscuta europaea TaxID=41803 RepID=A0A9P0ZPW4_CUSEU|nr:unnamed protein product [Cuscuta europaea]